MNMRTIPKETTKIIPRRRTDTNDETRFLIELKIIKDINVFEIMNVNKSINMYIKLTQFINIT